MPETWNKSYLIVWKRYYIVAVCVCVHSWRGICQLHTDPQSTAFAAILNCDSGFPSDVVVVTRPRIPLPRQHRNLYYSYPTSSSSVSSTSSAFYSAVAIGRKRDRSSSYLKVHTLTKHDAAPRFVDFSKITNKSKTSCAKLMFTYTYYSYLSWRASKANLYVYVLEWRLLAKRLRFVCACHLSFIILLHRTNTTNSTCLL